MNLRCEINEVIPNYFVFSFDDSFFYANATVILTSEGPVIIDTFRDRYQFDYICEFIKSKGYDKPHTIIYSHWHVDHTAGNRYFRDCNIVAHKALVYHFDDFNKKHIERMKDKGVLEKDACLIYPTQTFDTELKLKIGNKTFRLLHCPGHSYDSIIVFDEEAKTLIAGDNLVNKEVAFLLPPAIPPDEVDAKPGYYEAAYEVIESLKAEFIISGHGSIVTPDELIGLNKERYSKCMNEGLKYLE